MAGSKSSYKGVKRGYAKVSLESLKLVSRKPGFPVTRKARPNPWPSSQPDGWPYSPERFGRSRNFCIDPGIFLHESWTDSPFFRKQHSLPLSLVRQFWNSCFLWQNISCHIQVRLTNKFRDSGIEGLADQKQPARLNSSIPKFAIPQFRLVRVRYIKYN